MTTNPYEPAIRAVRRQIDSLRAKLERLVGVERELVELANLEVRTRPPTPAEEPRGSTANGSSPHEPPAGMTWKEFVIQILRESSRPLETIEIMRRTEAKGHPVKRTTLYWALSQGKGEGRAQKVGGKWVASEPELDLIDTGENDVIQ